MTNGGLKGTSKKVLDAAGSAFEFFKDEALTNFGNVMKKGPSGILEWGKVDLASEVIGILPVQNMPSTLSFQTPIVGGLDNLKTSTTGGGTVAFRGAAPWGLEFLTGGAGTDSAKGEITLGTYIFDNDCSLSICLSNMDISPSGASNMYFGLGDVTVAGGDHAMTGAHIGFYLRTVSGNINLYASCADGTTETRSSVITTVGADALKLYWVLDASAESVNFYYSKNGGAMTSAGTISSNVPVGNTSASNFQVSVGANGLGDIVGFTFVGALHTQY